MSRTIAKTELRQDSHWYHKDGRPCYELPKKDGSGIKVPTLADARKLNLLPSVTTILKLLNKPELNIWLQEQAILAVLTTPRLPQETDDAYVKRVLHTESVQEEESKAARERGTLFHDALDSLWKKQPIDPSLEPWVKPVHEALSAWTTICTEHVIVSRFYAGRIDLVQQSETEGPMPKVWIWDYKATKNIPSKAWPEHKLQVAAYAKAFQEMLWAKHQVEHVRIIPGVAYISSVEPGKFVLMPQEDWETTYESGFNPLIMHWQWRNDYQP